MKRQTKLFEFADLDDREEPMTVKRPRNRSDSTSSEVPPETTPLTLVDPREETQDNRTECGNESSSSGCLNISQISSSSTDSDSSHLFQPRRPHEPIIPNDIAHSRDDKPVQPQLRNFQKTRVGDRNRSFAVHWYQSYPFIEYSIQRDAVYCFSCRLFPSGSGYADTTFTTRGCNKWKKIGEKLKRHAESDAHKESMAKWMAYKQTKSSPTVADQLISQRASTVAANRMYISTLSQVAVLCARQGIALRGHDESSTSSNKGNYVEILELLASVMPELERQFRSLPNNAKYTSKVVQNDLLKAAGDVVIKQITDEIKDAEGFAVIADEARDVSKKEQLSLCLRYVNKNLEVNERFVGFSDLCDLDAKALAEKIVVRLQVLGLDVKQCIAQCYDGASVMSGQVSGVQQRLREIVGNGCVYIHCHAHR